MDILKWLEHWVKNYKANWEHCYGISIGTLDNPGWSVDISLFDTDMQDVEFKELSIDRSETDWIYCKVEDKKFMAAGGVANLPEMLNIFKNWVTSSENKIDDNCIDENYMDISEWLGQWFESNCDDDWEHCYGIVIETLGNPGWRVSISLSDTDLEDLEFKELSIDRSETDWIRCKVEDMEFISTGGLVNLTEMLTVFKEWVTESEEENQ